MVKNKFYKIKEEGEKIREELKEKTVDYIIAAFGFVAGLAWNEAVKALIDYIFPLSKDSVLAKFVYAILITIMLVIVTVNFVRLKKDNN